MTINTKTDIVLINPGDKRQVYQDLGADLAAIEPPFWVAVIAAYLRNRGFSVQVVDSSADDLSPDETADLVKTANPCLAAVIVYGSQPSASTQNMTTAGKICAALKDKTQAKVAIGGLHPSALPKRTMEEVRTDFIVDGEGPCTFEALIKSIKTGTGDHSSVPGLWYTDGGRIKHTPRAPLITDLDSTLPIAAWDLLPMQKYRAHNWHCFDDIGHRMPYGAIYTSLGCPYNCVFCCINAPFGNPGIRYRSPELVLREIAVLVDKYKVKNLKIVDELFVLKEDHYMKIVDMITEKGYDLNIWAYARVDTVKPERLAKMKKAGINWLALGIESANPAVRNGASKRMRAQDIQKVVRTIKDAGIRVIGNFIFGLPEDTLATMQETLDMAMALQCEFVNFYCAMAYPGSKLYDIALKEGWELPGQWHGFSQHSYEMQPLPTRSLSAKEVLKFRDDAFHKYFEDPEYLAMLGRVFGKKVREHMRSVTKTRLKRRLLGD